MARKSEGKATKVSKPVRVASMMAVDAVLRVLGERLGINLCDISADSHRRLRAACVDEVATVLDGRVI